MKLATLLILRKVMIAFTIQASGYVIEFELQPGEDAYFAVRAKKTDDGFAEFTGKLDPSVVPVGGSDPANVKDYITNIVPSLTKAHGREPYTFNVGAPESIGTLETIGTLVIAETFIHPEEIRVILRRPQIDKVDALKTELADAGKAILALQTELADAGKAILALKSLHRYTDSITQAWIPRSEIIFNWCSTELNMTKGSKTAIENMLFEYAKKTDYAKHVCAVLAKRHGRSFDQHIQPLSQRETYTAMRRYMTVEMQIRPNLHFIISGLAHFGYVIDGTRSLYGIRKDDSWNCPYSMDPCGFHYCRDLCMRCHYLNLLLYAIRFDTQFKCTIQICRKFSEISVEDHSRLECIQLYCPALENRYTLYIAYSANLPGFILPA